MEELTLAAISAIIEPPQAADEPGTAPVPAPDRLSELAAWWQLAGGAQAPQRVGHLWAQDDTGPATLAQVTPEPWEPPSPSPIPDVIAWAVRAADASIDEGAELVLLSVPAGGGASAPATLAAALLTLDAVDAAGWPSATGMSDMAWMGKVAAIRDGLQRLRGPSPASSTTTSNTSTDATATDATTTGSITPSGLPDARTAPDELLSRLGDASLAAGCAVLLRCASRRTPVILEGMGSAVCALLALRASPASRAWSIAADGPVPVSAASPASARVAPMSRNPLQDRVLEALARDPLTRLGLSWADGTGARIALNLLETAVNRTTS